MVVGEGDHCKTYKTSLTFSIGTGKVKMKRTSKDQLKQFEQQVTGKKTGTKKHWHIVPEDFIVQRMLTSLAGRMEKHERFCSV